MTTIAEILKVMRKDYDTYDEVFDVCVTCCDMTDDEATYRPYLTCL